ncbi:hypothetical protein FOC1_h10017637, partial [Fusarium oxysporum f. sp. cubense race 1]
ALASYADVPSPALSKFSSIIVLFHCVSMTLHQLLIPTTHMIALSLILENSYHLNIIHL